MCNRADGVIRTDLPWEMKDAIIREHKGTGPYNGDYLLPLDVQPSEEQRAKRNYASHIWSIDPFDVPSDGEHVVAAMLRSYPGELKFKGDLAIMDMSDKQAILIYCDETHTPEQTQALDDLVGVFRSAVAEASIKYLKVA